MLLSALDRPDISIPIESYSKRLTWFMHQYLDMLDVQSSMLSKNAHEKALITLKWIIFPNKETKKDFNLIENKIGKKTIHILRRYTTCIMQLVGKLAECVVVDKCCSDLNINKICINIAQYREDIYGEYEGIQYDEYVAFSTSFEYMIYKNPQTGIYERYFAPDYNPNHTSKDVGWCRKDNHLTQLKVDKPELGYVDNAKLQIKATINCSTLNLDGYFPTPVLFFDLCNDFHAIKNSLPYNIIPARIICPEMELELEQYFRILGAYAVGFINSIDLSSLKIEEDKNLADLFRTPIGDILEEQRLNLSGMISLVEKMQKPVVIGV